MIDELTIVRRTVAQPIARLDSLAFEDQLEITSDMKAFSIFERIRAFYKPKAKDTKQGKREDLRHDIVEAARQDSGASYASRSTDASHASANTSLSTTARVHVQPCETLRPREDVGLAVKDEWPSLPKATGTTSVAPAKSIYGAEIEMA